MRIRKRVPHVATAAAAGAEELRLQQLSDPAFGSLSNHGRSVDGVHDDGGRSRIAASPPGMGSSAGGLCTMDCQNVAEATSRPQPTGGTIPPVSMKFSSTPETCMGLRSNGGGQDHRPPPTIVINSSTSHISSNIEGGHGSEGGEDTPGSLNILSNLDSSGTMDTDRASDSSVLFQSLVHLFDRAGKEGFTVSEAVSEIVEQGLPGLEEGSKRFNVQVAKALRSPCFVRLTSGRYFLYHFVSSKVGPDKLDFELHHNGVLHNITHLEDGKCAILSTSRRKRGVHAADAAFFSTNLDTEAEGGTLPRQEESWAQFRKRRRRAPVSQRELSIGPTQCKRYDGRGWQCTQKTEEGCSFCEHHQALINKRNLRLKLAKFLSGTKGSAGTDYKLSNTGVHLPTGIQSKSVSDMDAGAKSQKQIKLSDGVLKLQVQPQDQLKAVKACSLKSMK